MRGGIRALLAPLFGKEHSGVECVADENERALAD